MDFFNAVLPDETGWLPIITRNSRGQLAITEWFLWPDEQELMQEHINSKRHKDVYFSPMLYSEPPTRRSSTHVTKDNVTAVSVVWADADTAQPDVFLLTPTIKVETSPQRWHIYWRITDTKDPAAIEELAHSVADTHKRDGVDNGWALSKRLRVPNTTNTKYNDNFTVTATGDGWVYTYDEFASKYPQVVGAVDNLVLPDDVPNAIAVLNTIDANPTLLSLYTSQPIGDWSTELYKLEKELFKYGLSEVEVFSVAKSAACNKFARDNRPDAHLWQQVLKTKQLFDEERATKTVVIDEPVQKAVDWSDISLLTEEEREAVPETVIDRYADWAKVQSARSARQYHETSAFCILSTVFSEYGHIMPSWGPTPLNMYFLLLGKTTRSKKSTAKNLMLRFIDELSSEDEWDYDLGQDATPEALTEVLGQRPGKSSLFWRDEVQGLFSQTASGGYLRGLLPMLTDAYDGYVQGVLRKTGNTKRTRKTKTNLIFYGMGIVDQVAEVLTDDDFYSGFLPRVIFSIDTDEVKELGNTDVFQRDPNVKKDEDVEFKSIYYSIFSARQHWKKLKEKNANSSVPVIATDAVWKRWQEATVQLETMAANHPRSDVLSPGATRLGVSILKAAALLSMYDTADRIEMRHLLPALKFATDWAKYMEYMVQNVSKTVQSKELEEIEELVSSYAGPIPYSKVLKHFKGRKSVREFNEMLDFLVESGSIIVTSLNKVKVIEMRG